VRRTDSLSVPMDHFPIETTVFIVYRALSYA